MDNLNYWKNKWIEVGKDYILNKNTTDENIMVWDNSSKDYDKSVGNERVDEVIGRLENLGYIDEESIVLDLGCGTGAYSIALSGVCKRVDALDYSDGMLEVLRKKIESEGIDNINILNKDWMDIDLENEGMYKKYDFVFCSLNPGCYNPDSLLKINEASKSYCCYISTDGRGKNDIINKADCEILGEKIKGNDISSVIYPFNILYFAGYRPVIFYTPCDWIYKLDEKKAISKLIKRYSEYINVDDHIKKKIEVFVRNNLEDNMFIDKNENNLGILIWNVERR